MKRLVFAAILLGACHTYDVSGTAKPGDLDGDFPAETPAEMPADAGKITVRFPAVDGGNASDAGAPRVGNGILANAKPPLEGTAPGELEGVWQVEKLYQTDDCGGRNVDRADVLDVTWHVTRDGADVDVVTDDVTQFALEGYIDAIPTLPNARAVVLQGDLNPETRYTLQLDLAPNVQTFRGMETTSYFHGECSVARAVIGSRP